MRLSEKDLSGEEIYECDRCRVRGERKTFVIMENDGQICLSCWLEKEHNRITRRPLTAGF